MKAPLILNDSSNGDSRSIIRAVSIDRRALTDHEAAAYIGMSVSFLRISRMDGDRANRTPGPKFIKVGKAVRYLRDDLDSWLEARRVQRGKSDAASEK